MARSYRRAVGPAGLNRGLTDRMRGPAIGTSSPHPRMPKPNTLLDKSSHPKMNIPSVTDSDGDTD